MPLINNIQQAKDAGLKIQFSNTNPTLADMKAAERRFLLPILGKDLLNILLQPSDEKYNELLSVAKRAEAHLAYWLDLPVIQTQITDGGLRTFENNNSQAAHRWEYKEVQDMLQQKGCEALEEMLEILHENATDFNWQMPAAFNSVFLTGNDFAQYFALYQPFRTFEQLRPVIKQAEDQYIISTIGQEFYTALLASQNLTELDKKVIVLIKKALAQLTIKIAVEILPVKISAGGFTVLLSASNDEPNGTQQQAPGNFMSLLHSSCDKAGNAYISQLVQLLDASASDSVFTAYFSSSLYTAPIPETDIINRNANRKTFGL